MKKMKELLFPIFHYKAKFSWNKKNKELLLPILSIKRKQYFTKNHHTWKSLWFYYSSSWISLKSIEIPFFLFHCDFQKMHEITIPWKCVHYKKFFGKKSNQGMLLQLISITWKVLNYLYHSHHCVVLWPLLHTLKCSLEAKTCTTLEENNN
jgi:hypothetical protein